MVTIKLFVDEGKNQVVFAESDSDFVDVLLSFLTIPLGTFVRLCGKESNLGCMDNLYKSVESLDDDRHMRSKGCKTILLRPRNAWKVDLKNLPVKFLEESCYSEYICSTWGSCMKKGHCYYSTLPDYAPCAGCGKTMTKNVCVYHRDVPAGEIFIKGNRRFLTTDDLQVIPLTTGSFLALLKRLGIHDATRLKQVMVANIGTDEVLGLLKRSLLSPTPLSDVFLLKHMDTTISSSVDSTAKLACLTNDKKTNNRTFSSSSSFLDKLVSARLTNKINNSSRGTKKTSINVNVILNSATKKLLYVEDGGEGFIDFLFSFLTFPLSSIAKLVSDDADSSVGCLHNLYKSVRDLCTTTSSSGGLIILHSENHKASLLNPQLAPYHGCKNQLLPVEEAEGYSGEFSMIQCETCIENRTYSGPGKCAHGILARNILKPLNPKEKPTSVYHSSRKGVDDEGGGFVKSLFMVTDQLHVQPLSLLQVIKPSNITSSGNLEQRTVTIGRQEAVKLLKACLTSKTPLTDVFLNTRANKGLCQLRKIFHGESKVDAITNID